MDFSFIIPVYNAGEHLPACVDSILSSGASSLEILLVDDGSTDGSSVLCDALSQKDSRIRVIHQANAGVYAARNAGLQAARGEYILFADADDTLSTRELGTLLQDCCHNKADLTLFGLSFDYYRQGVCYRTDPLFFKTEGLLTREQWGRDLISLYRCNSLSSVWNKVYKRSILQENHLLLNPQMFLYEDLEFVLRYLAYCESLWNVPKAVYHYRQSEDEGNAGRRLSRISHICFVTDPIEDAFHSLCRANGAIAQRDCEIILQMLYLVLAREKIQRSGKEEIRRICRDYRAWEPEHISCPQHSPLRDRLWGEKVNSIRFQRARAALRHRLAVTVKSTLYRLRNKPSRT